MKLVLYPPIDRPRLDQLHAAAPSLPIVNCETHAEAIQEMGDATAFFGRIDRELLAASGPLSWVQSPTASLEHYVFPELIEHPCTLTNMRGLFSDVIADHVLGYLLCIVRNIHLYMRQQLQHRWEPIGGESTRPGNETGPGHASPIDHAHRHLADCTMGIVGVGAIGGEIARRAAAFGMTIRGVDPLVKSLPGVIEQVWSPEHLPDLLADSDFVVIAAPHTPHTEKMFRSEQLSQMQPNSWLVNIGRGAIVDLADLTQALQNGTIAGAALDVFEEEPLPPDHPLWDMQNVLITPHIAAASPRVPERHLETLLTNVQNYANGQTLLNVVDKPNWF